MATGPEAGGAPVIPEGEGRGAHHGASREELRAGRSPGQDQDHEGPHRDPGAHRGRRQEDGRREGEGRGGGGRRCQGQGRSRQRGLGGGAGGQEGGRKAEGGRGQVRRAGRGAGPGGPRRRSRQGPRGGRQGAAGRGRPGGVRAGLHPGVEGFVRGALLERQAANVGPPGRGAGLRGEAHRMRRQGQGEPVRVGGVGFHGRDSAYVFLVYACMRAYVVIVL